MDEKQAVQQIVSAITPELWYLFFQMILTAILSLALIQVLRSIVSYCFVRFDKELSKNVKVIFDGKEGYITDVNLQNLTITMVNGNEIFVPITKVRSMIWEIPKRNGKKKED